LRSLREVLPTLSRQLLRCDPLEHKEGTTFLQVKKFMQVSLQYIRDALDIRQTLKPDSGYQAGYRISGRIFKSVLKCHIKY
jgi:hypothetical protein